MNNRIVRRFVALERRRRRAEELLERIKQELADVRPLVLEQMSQAGLQRINMDGMTIYLRRTLWVKADNRADVVAALRACGLGDYVQETYNTNSLSALIREAERTHEVQFSSCRTLAELEAQGITIPPEIAGLRHVIGLSEVIEPVTRKEN